MLELSRRLFRPRQRWRAPNDVTGWVMTPGMSHNLINEPFGVPRQEPLLIPSDDSPPANRCAPATQWDRVDSFAWNEHAGGQHRNAISGGCKRDQGMRGRAFEQHTRLNVCDLARGVEPFTRRKAPARQQQRFIG